MEVGITRIMQAICPVCGRARKGLTYICPECGSPFVMEPDFKFQDGVEKNFPYVKHIVSLGEVQTPVVSLKEFALKLDYYQPTFSYKDRGSRILISFLRENAGTGSIINEDSSGNAGCSVSAYGQSAGFRVRIFVPERAMPVKLSQIKAYGAEIVRVQGGRSEVAESARKADGIYAGHAYWPEFRDGIRTLAYEIFRQFDHIPDSIYIPLSAGTLYLGLTSGFEHLQRSGEIDSVPEIIAVQPEGNSPVCSAIDGIKREFHETVADALITRKSPLLDILLEKIKKYGRCVYVSDSETISAHEDLSRKGILAEYSSAVALAGFRKKRIGSRPLIVLTGSGLKTLVTMS